MILKEIKEVNNMYSISDNGDVYANERIVNGRKYKSKKLKQQIGYGGYNVIQFRVNKKKLIYYVHRLVAMYFVDGYFDGALVNHIDCNKFNNNSNNLEWVTKSENSKHSPTINSSRKYSNEDIYKIRKMKEDGLSIYRISVIYKENSGVISNIVNKKTYKEI